MAINLKYECETRETIKAFSVRPVKTVSKFSAYDRQAILELKTFCLAWQTDNWYDCELVQFVSPYSVFEYSFWTYTKLVPNKVPKNFVQGKI